MTSAATEDSDRALLIVGMSALAKVAQLARPHRRQ
jgi:hypothetical protein